MEAIEAAGGKPFFDYQVPAAVITLKQGFGRLIRSLEDRGVLMSARPPHPAPALRPDLPRIASRPTASPRPSPTWKPSSPTRQKECEPLQSAIPSGVERDLKCYRMKFFAAYNLGSVC
jgi:hypothetical protein